jgi:hypothetical protein
MKKKYYVIYRNSWINENESCYYVEEGVWALSINEALFFEEKAGAEFTAEHIFTSTGLKVDVRESIINEIEENEHLH